MTDPTPEDVLRLVLKVQDENPGAHPVALAYELRSRYHLQISGKQVERLLRHNSTER